MPGASSNYNDREARFAKRYAQRRLTGELGNPSGFTAVNVRVPDDVERRAEHTPCTYCGTARACRHRPWA